MIHLPEDDLVDDPRAASLFGLTEFVVTGCCGAPLYVGDVRAAEAVLTLRCARCRALVATPGWEDLPGPTEAERQRISDMVDRYVVDAFAKAMEAAEG